MDKYGRKTMPKVARFSLSLFQYGKVIMPEGEILLIDDDVTLLELLSDHLTVAGYHTHTASNGFSGLSLAKQANPDLVILDLMMPQMNGWDVCTRLREESSVPVIMLSAKSEEIDKLRGFRLGIDDYVTKPFSFAELTARIGAILARSGSESSVDPALVRGDLSIDIGQRRVSKSGQTIELTPTEFRLLETLVRFSGRTVPTDALLHNTWGDKYSGEERHVKHYIWALRKKLEDDPGNPKHILTERGFGYRFE
jgi:DNA-binding response OmpR family regulator